MTTSNPIPDPVNEESQTLHPADPSLASAVAPQKEERDYLVIGLIIALMAIVVAGFFSLDSKMDRLITQMGVDTQKTGLNAWMGAPTNRGNARVDALATRMDARVDALKTRMDARIDGLYKVMLSPKT